MDNQLNRLGIDAFNTSYDHLALNISNEFSRSAFFKSSQIDSLRNINAECGYPDEITPEQYYAFYSREGTATRVVAIFPEESWSVDPIITENEDLAETEFELAWAELEQNFNLYHYLERADELSGVGEFGILLLGIDDGKELHEEVEGIKDFDILSDTAPSKKHKLVYVRVFPQVDVEIKRLEKDRSNKRFGQPVSYDLTTVNDVNNNTQSRETKTIHWTRVIHLADNRKSSEVYGTPRQENVFNRLYDLRKIVSGSGEMFWKGAFPGFSFELDPRLVDSNVQIDKKGLREEISRWENGLQRYLALQGLTAKSLAPQAVDPGPHAQVQLKAIALAKGIPWRIFAGSEEAKLASDQDKKIFNKSISRRQNKYITPMILREFLNRLIAYGTLPKPKKYNVTWPDMNIVSDKDKIDVAFKKTQALAMYIKGDVDTLIPPLHYFTDILNMDVKEAQAIIKAATLLIGDEGNDDDDNPEGNLDEGNE